MSEVKNNPAATADPLDTPCEGVDTSFPLLQGDKVYRLEVKKATVGPAKKNPQGQVLTLQLNTTTESISSKGESIGKGFPIYHRMSLTPTPEYPIDKVVKNLASVVKALGGEKAKLTPRAIINDPKQLEGGILDAKVGIAPEKDGYPESNIVRQFIPVS